MRVIALWCPDWPAHALRLEQGLGHEVAVGVLRQGLVWVCSASARAQGVRRGMRARVARAACPQVVLVDADEARDARLFEPIVAGVDDVSAGVEVLRPGLVVVAAQAPTKFYGSEDAACQVLLDAAAARGVDTCVGVADELVTAVIAARAGTVVPVGKSREFLSGVALSQLVAEEHLDVDVDTVAALQDVGVRTLGEVAALPARSVGTRFGAAGMHIVDIATARVGRDVAPPLPEVERVVRFCPPEPMLRVDEAAFAARTVAAELVALLVREGLVCERLRISVDMIGEDDEATTRLTRTWHARGMVDERSLAERIRWQLDGWLSGGGQGAVAAVEVDPVECSRPRETGLWDQGTSRDDAAREVTLRVQSHLGVDKVLQPHLAGGRGPTERIDFVPVGQPLPPDQPMVWPGTLPAPHPARRGGGPTHPAARIAVNDAGGQPVSVTADIVLSAAPATISWGQEHWQVTGWAGPWPVDECWWRMREEDKHTRLARMQVVGRTDSGRVSAWLMVWWGGRWRVEATYD